MLCHFLAAGVVSDAKEIRATRVFGSATWTGSNLVEIFPNEDAPNVQIVLSDPATQGAITGVVRDTNGQTLGGARVHASLTIAGTNPTRFDNPGAYLDITLTNGTYTLPNLPPGTTYILTASYPGRSNITLNNVAVTAGGTTTQDLTLNTASGAPSDLPNIANLEGTAITTPTVLTRAAGGLNQSDGLEAVKQWVLAKKRLKSHHAADTGRVVTRKIVTRATPSGSNIDVVLLWDYATYSNLYGYLILRSPVTDTNYTNIAVATDPLADRFSDGDPALTPGTLYYYSVERLDTVNYAVNGIEPTPATLPEEISVRPLGPISLTSPGQNAVTSAPNFSWTTTGNATIYQVLLYNQFPALQSSTDTVNGTQPVWQKTLNGTVGSTAYDGPALVSGTTYYWTVLASDSTNADISISPLRSFTAP